MGWLNDWRYSSWKQSRLQCLPYQGLSASAVSGSSTTSSIRRRSDSMVSKSSAPSAAASSGVPGSVWVSSHSTSVHPSWTRLRSGFSPVTAEVKLRIRSSCQPGSRPWNHSTSVGALARTPTADGVRWNTNTSFAARASWGTNWIEVAPVPMIPTRLSASPSMGSVGLPPV